MSLLLQAHSVGSEGGGGSQAHSVLQATSSWCALAALVAFVTWSTPSLYAVAYAEKFTVVSGQLRQTSYEPDGSVKTSRAWDYVLQIGGTAWALECLETSQVPAGAAGWKRVAGDAHDLFYTFVFSPDPAKPGSASGPRVHAHAEPGEFPAMAGGAELLLWLAYCSGPYLAKHGSLPSMREPFNNALHAFVRTEFHTPEAGCPPTHLQQVSACLMPFRPAGTSQAAPVRLPPPLDSGWMDFCYTVGDTTNLTGVHVPLSFRASYYLPDASPQPAVYCATVLTGWVQRAEAALSPVLSNALPQAARVFDTRFTNSAGLPAMYWDQQGAGFIDREAPNAVDQLSSKRPLQPVSKPRVRTAARWAVLVCLALVTFFVAVVLVRSGGWRRRTSPSS